MPISLIEREVSVADHPVALDEAEAPTDLHPLRERIFIASRSAGTYRENPRLLEFGRFDLVEILPLTFEFFESAGLPEQAECPEVGRFDGGEFVEAKLGEDPVAQISLQKEGPQNVPYSCLTLLTKVMDLNLLDIFPVMAQDRFQLRG